MARPSMAANLSEEEITELRTAVRSTKVESRIKQRSYIILDWHDGKSYDETQALRNVSRRVVAKWRNRFLKHRMRGLADAARSGKPVVITEAKKNKVIHLASSKPSKGYSSWSQQRIGEEIGISQSKVNKILQGHGLRPHNATHRSRKSANPEFESKILTLVGLYMNPPENAIVLCIDRKTQIQTLSGIQPELPHQQGKPKRLTATHNRYGVANLITSPEDQHEEIMAKTKDTNNSDGFLNYLTILKRKYIGKRLHIIADNPSVQKHKRVKEWVAQNENVELHYTSAYSLWLNQVEIWFNILSKDVVNGTEWHSKKQLVDQLMEYITTYSKESAKPLKWMFSPG